MVWYKSWFETRFKLVLAVVVTAFLLALMHAQPATARVPSARPPILAMQTTVTTFMVWIATWLAGAGIATQSAFQATKGLHGSMLFTLSLPVSRFRLLAVRSGVGWLELTAVIAALCWGMWLVAAPLRSIVTPMEMVAYAATLVGGASVFYFLSVWLATFLEDQWRMMGTIVAFFGWVWLSSRVGAPAWIDIFQTMGRNSPLMTHTVPWVAMMSAAGLSAVFFAMALIVVHRREY